MNHDTQLAVGLGFLGLVIALLCVYVAWNVFVRGGRIRRAAEEDRQLVESDEMTEAVLFEKIQSTIPTLFTANALLAGITIAAMFIIIAQITFTEAQFQGIKQGIILASLFLAGVSSICWLLCLEQFTQMSAPSIKYDSLLRFYRYTFNLWVVGLTFMLADIYFFLLLANLYVAMAAGFATFWIVIGYWNIHNDWPVRQKNE